MTTMKTRFAPSPTGYLHLGNVRTALFNALLAGSANGHFVLRVEDTDQERSQAQYVAALLEDLRWLGLAWQEGPEVGGAAAPYAQSQRTALYAAYYQRLEEGERVYPCFCTAAELALSRLAEEDANHFDVVFTDVVMPGMSGIELGQKIRSLYPDLPVVLTSGYSHVLAQNGTYGFELLHKPYSMEQASQVLQKSAAWRLRQRTADTR